MQLREILIWKNWLYQNSTRFDRYEYNVRLGDGVDPGPSYPDSSRRMWIANSMKRVDVVAVKGDRITIIEVEENPGLTAFGQLAGYVVLWRARIGNDALAVARSSGVAVEVIATDFSPLKGAGR